MIHAPINSLLDSCYLTLMLLMLLMILGLTSLPLTQANVTRPLSHKRISHSLSSHTPASETSVKSLWLIFSYRLKMIHCIHYDKLSVCKHTHTTQTYTHTHTPRTHAKYVSLQGQNTTDFCLFPCTPANTRAKMC